MERSGVLRSVDRGAGTRSAALFSPPSARALSPHVSTVGRQVETVLGHTDKLTIYWVASQVNLEFRTSARTRLRQRRR